MLRKQFLFFFLLFFCSSLMAQTYYSLDKKNPISFNGSTVTYQGKSFKLGPKIFFLDGNLPQEVVDKYPFVFRTFQEVNAKLKDGTEMDPMIVFIAPWVYWINDPDSPNEVRTADGSAPIGMYVKCENLHLIGLNPNPANIIFASRRGQTQGSRGNFTMLDFTGNGLTIKNMTLGNFCNVDLEFPLNKTLNREKRNSAFTQAHVAYCHGDRIYAENVRFISRLNMNPLGQAKRILFNNCHMECTDDALTSTGVYLNCEMEFYGTKPFWNSDRYGAIFLNSDFYIKHLNGRQNFTKSLNPLSIIDCRYHALEKTYPAWTLVPDKWLRCYQANVTMNGQPVVISASEPENTILLDGKPALTAFKLENGSYNIYNLLRGDDDWDPLHQKDSIKTQYTNLATCLKVTPQINQLQTGKDSVCLHVDAMRHVGYNLNAFYKGKIHWKVEPGFEKYVQINPNGNDCVIYSKNEDDTTKLFSIIAYTEDGLEGATTIKAKPSSLPAPIFLKEPKIKINKGEARVDYQLQLHGRTDQSLITWYRINKDQEHLVSVSRNGKPELTYQLKPADNGCKLKVTIEPMHVRSELGKKVTIISDVIKMKPSITRDSQLSTDFSNFPTINQFDLKPGLWTLDGNKPSDITSQNWIVDKNSDYWTFDSSINGCKGMGLLQARQGSRLRYTPIGKDFSDMDVTLVVDPCKQDGQGFSSAREQYMDICVKFDTKTLTGYGLRIIRTTKYSNAVDFLLVQYDNGRITPISSPITSNCYLTNCTIHIYLKDDTLHATASTTTPLQLPADDRVKPTVDLTAKVTPNQYGGFAIQHTGTTGEGITMLHKLYIQWK